ncbi:MAG: class I SAM-dependent methyltransferase [Chloroflexi bacterium]|nr:class I SAM-dependent methyltransferase [Chloroflexota bacterium]
MTYTRSAAWYDVLYGMKDYARESQGVHAMITQHKRSTGNTLLDVACGTGRHLEFLREWYAIKGLDLEAGLLESARERCPGVEFVVGDMTQFDLGEQFDVVTCLFSAIGYVRTVDRLGLAIQHMANHVKPGGVLIVEPWFECATWNVGRIHANFIDQPDLKIARMNISEIRGSAAEGWYSRNDMHFLVATPQGVEHFVERHDLGLFEVEQYLAAFTASGLEPIHDPQGITGRGMYIGKRGAG